MTQTSLLDAPQPAAADGGEPPAADGRKLGRKGQETRERIVCAMLALISDPDGPPVTLTSVARAASIRLPNLYVYFPDMGDLLLTALERVMASAEEGYLELLRRRWPDQGLEEACAAFLRAHLAFWRRNARILHMRNALADANDARVFHHRQFASRPLIDMLMAQMDHDGKAPEDGIGAIATVLLTGIERTATVMTNPQYLQLVPDMPRATKAQRDESLIAAEAKIIALAIAAHRKPG